MTTQTTLDLDGIIGWDVTAGEVRAALASAVSPVTLRINSPGGDVHEGVAIANALRQYRREGGEVCGVITGLAASMASYIAMFADRLEVEDNAILMVHNPWSLAMGDYRVMEKAAGILGSLRTLLARAYADKSARAGHSVLADMDAESWYFGEEIVTHGYADALIPAGDGPESQSEAMALAQSSFNAMRAKLKEREADSGYLDRVAALLPALSTPAAAAALNPESPMSAHPRAEAEPSVSLPSTETTEDPRTDQPDAIELVPEAVAQAAPGEGDGAPPDPSDLEAIRQQAIAEERERVAAITELCASVKQSALAAGYIVAGLSLEQTHAELLKVWAASAGPEIQANVSHSTSVIDAAALQRQLFQQVAKGISK